MGSRPDRRVERTISAITRALFELVSERGYDRTTVQDIIDRANVGRSTFYSHFDTKDDLLLSSLEGLNADLDAHLPEPGPDEPLLPSLGLFVHIEEQHHVFSGLFRSRAIDLVTNQTIRMLEARALRALGDRADDHPVSPETRAAFLARSLMAFARWWIAQGRPHGPEWASATFDRLAASA